MSKIGKKPIAIPEGVEIKVNGNVLEVKGPKGTLALDMQNKASVNVGAQEIIVAKSSENNSSSGNLNAVWGLTRALINNMVVGVTSGYEKKLELQGVGYRMNIQGKKIVMALGFSHPVEVEIPETLTVKLEEGNILSVSGIDKQEVGQFAANVRALKEVEPYKGKGFRYVGEKVRRKVGKKAGAK